MSAASSSTIPAVPKMESAPVAAASAAPALPKSVIFGTAGLGGMMGWAIVHPANTIAGKAFSYIEI